MSDASPEQDSATKNAEAQHDVLGVPEDHAGSFQRTTHPEAQWFPKAGLGLFIHWGLSAVHGELEISWSMINNFTGKSITPNQYFALAEQWNPDSYDPDKWLRAARDAGFRYAVLTTKHHDGYTLWPSECSDFGTQSHMGGRDLVAPFVDACRRNGMKIGLYYSPWDLWFDREYHGFGNSPELEEMKKNNEPVNGLGLDHEPKLIPPKPAEHIARHRDMVRGHVQELLTRYGHIDVLWFDGGNNEVSPEFVRGLQPHIVVNARIWGVGDFDHTECRLPESKPEGWFETCHISAASNWAYQTDEKMRPAKTIVEELRTLHSWGANYLLNVGPKPNGELADYVYDHFTELGMYTPEILAPRG